VAGWADDRQPAADEDVDWIVWTCEPPHPARDRLRDAVRDLRSAAGLDVCIGRRLPSLLRAAGLADVGVAADLRLWHAGDACRTLLLTFVANHRSQLIASGLLAAEELDDSAAALAAHLAGPGTFVVYTPLFQAWGRKPA
jgi:hypothetical protein